VRKADTSDARILRLALIATLAADFLLEFIENPLYGLCAFCCVQMIYCLRYGGVRMCGILAGLWSAMTPLLLLFNTELLFIVAALYAVAFICSLSSAFAAKKRYSYTTWMFVVCGMSLFACCDISVGINYLIPGSAYPLLWIFYLPGQALLSVSGMRQSDESCIESRDIIMHEDDLIC